jgi:hypothetical protein
MSPAGRPARLVTVHGRRLGCVVCGESEFVAREVKVNTTGAEYFGYGWANESATGLACVSCGYLHEFLGDAIELWEPDGGYPDGAE